MLIVQEAEHARFKRSGKDLVYTADISLATALCGTILSIPTLDDRLVQVAINDVVTPATKKVVPGEGMPLSKNPSQRGDLVIQFKIQFPTYLAEGQKRLIKEAL